MAFENTLNKCIPVDISHSIQTLVLYYSKPPRTIKNTVKYLFPSLIMLFTTQWFDVFLTMHHSIELFHLPTLMHNSLFINNMYVTLPSSTCFKH
jgi:hypothetical protein